jgi:hypothetical protein
VGISSSAGTIQVRCKVTDASWDVTGVTITATETRAAFGPARHTRRALGDRFYAGPRNLFVRPAKGTLRRP